jgi:hypothetical protein
VAREAVVKANGAGLNALREVQLGTGSARCRGEVWYEHTAELFPGARACVMTSVPGQELITHAVPLTELFIP